MYAVISTGGKQYKVSAGDEVFVERLSGDEGKKLNFDVLAINADGKGLVFGSPFVKEATVAGTIIKNGKGKKITVFTYKPKKGEKRKLGHRQPYSKVQITELKYKDLSESIKDSKIKAENKNTDETAKKAKDKALEKTTSDGQLKAKTKKTVADASKKSK